MHGDFSRKSQKISHPFVFCVPLKGFPRNWVPAPGVKKTIESWGYRAEKKIDDIFSCLDTIHQRDGQTDGRTPGDSKDRAYA